MNATETVPQHKIEDVLGDATCLRCGRVFRGHWLGHPEDLPCDPVVPR